MTKEEKIEVLKKAGSNADQAISLLNLGTEIFSSAEEYIDMLKSDNIYNGETPESIREHGEPEIVFVEYNGKEYLIQYVM